MAISNVGRVAATAAVARGDRASHTIYLLFFHGYYYYCYCSHKMMMSLSQACNRRVVRGACLPASSLGCPARSGNGAPVRAAAVAVEAIYNVVVAMTAAVAATITCMCRAVRARGTAAPAATAGVVPTRVGR